MVPQAEGRIDGDGECAGADRHMRILHADDIDQQRHGEHRAAAADEAEREADRGAAAGADQILNELEMHLALVILRAAARIFRSYAACTAIPGP